MEGRGVRKVFHISSTSRKMRSIKEFVTQNYKKKPRNFHSWQELGARIIELGKIEKKDTKLVFIFASRTPTQKLFQIVSGIKQGEIKPPVIRYIKWLMKENV